MTKTDFFKEMFDQLATDGCIGDSFGECAFAYIRVSSEEQAEEGRSGLPRQILHIHEIARDQKLKIPRELVFADDASGFEFRSRPALGRFRQEIAHSSRRANWVVMESIDRLSRNADWHQGYLLDEMKEAGVKDLFWKSYSSRIERAVMGAISQEGMEQAKERMAEGNRIKARSGRITARTRALWLSVC